MYAYLNTRYSLVDVLESIYLLTCKCNCLGYFRCKFEVVLMPLLGIYIYFLFTVLSLACCLFRQIRNARSTKGSVIRKLLHPQNSCARGFRQSLPPISTTAKTCVSRRHRIIPTFVHCSEISSEILVTKWTTYLTGISIDDACLIATLRVMRQSVEAISIAIWCAVVILQSSPP